MQITERRIVRIGCLLLLVALAASVIAGCGNSTVYVAVTPTPTISLKTPNDPKPVTVVRGQATTLDLGEGAHLIIPPGAMTPGATVSATYKGRPDGNWINIAPTFAPVELISNPPNAIHGLLTLEFPIPVYKIASGIDPAVQFGVSTYDPATKTWTPFDSTYDPARHMIVALIPHFSWWNPFTWDFDALFASVAQGFGQLTGARAGPATCSGSVPGWVGSLAGVTNDNDVAIRSCGKSKGSILDIEIVNNRPYGQILTYGSGVQWGWHEDGKSLSEIALDHFMDANMLPTQLYLPPLSRASVGIFQTKAATTTNFHIGPTQLSIGADFLFYLLGQAVDYIPFVGECASIGADASLSDTSASALRDDLVMVYGCIHQGLEDAVKTKALSRSAANKIKTLIGKVKYASALVDGITLVGGAVWKLADLVADWIVNRGTVLGNGFNVYAKSASPPPTVTPVPPHPHPTPTPVPPQSHPVNAYDNYGQSNLAGHAMCRGNPGNPLSMPGGTGTQTFTVPSGVATLSRAKVQIDPASVTAHMTISVNGQVAATAVADAVGDTQFSFGPVPVHAGDVVSMSITFTATYGKIITLYTVGNPGGTFTAKNTCPDGAPSFSTSSTGLRAVVSGMS